MTRPKGRPGQAAWSLEGGAETCGFCVQHYHIEVGYYCAACDRPVCPLCVTLVVLRDEVLCPECAAEDER